jgi:hypothetical protein
MFIIAYIHYAKPLWVGKHSLNLQTLYEAVVAQKYNHNIEFQAFRSDTINYFSKKVLLFFLDYETIGTAATPGLLCQPRVIMKMIVKSMIECRLAGETEVLGENLPQRHFCPSQNPTCPPGYEPGPPRWEPGD